jgi:hypothetical protein
MGLEAADQFIEFVHDGLEFGLGGLEMTRVLRSVMPAMLFQLGNPVGVACL